MKSTELDYELPPELIAQRPAARRDASRLLVYDRASGAIRHRTFAELAREIEGHLTVVNDTRVVPARLDLRRETGGAVEVLLLERTEDGLWEALARPARRLRPGERLEAPSRRTPSSSSRRSGREDGACASRESRTAPCRCRRTSTRRRPIPSATRPSTRAIPARRRRRPPACTSRPSCSPPSTTSASRCTSGSTPSGRSRRRRSRST